MKNGLYRVSFKTPLGSGFGVVVLDNGRIRGGDHAMAYVGRLEEQGDAVTAHFQTFRHSSAVGANLLGAEETEMTVSGFSTNGERAELSGDVPGQDMVFWVRLHWMHD